MPNANQTIAESSAQTPSPDADVVSAPIAADGARAARSRKASSTTAAADAATSKGASTDAEPTAADVAHATVDGAAAPATKPARGQAAKAPRAAKNGSRAAEPAPVSDWTPEELVGVRESLSAELAEMQAEYEVSLRELNELQSSSTDGAGDDQADAGSKTFDREQELSITANRLDLISQITHAIERVDKGRYGLCEVCGKPIPRVRLEAFPMATLDVACKQREERR